MKNAIVFVYCALFSMILYSCHKKDNIPVSTTPTYASMEEVFAMLSLQPKIITVDATTTASYYGNSGTRYIFNGNSFMTATGVPVTGSVQMRVCEYLQKGDMIFSKMLPISNNEPLLSGGEISVSATQNGLPVYLMPHNYFQANLPFTGTAPAGISFFSGHPTLDTSTFKTNWVMPAKDSSQYNSGIAKVVYGHDTLSIISDSLRLCNADAFLTNPDYQTFTVTVTGIPSGSSLPYAYALYDNYKAVWRLGFMSGGSYANGVFTEKHVPYIPVHFVIFTLVNGKFYAGIGAATPVTGTNYTVNLREQDANAFKTLVNGL